jgi:hypothetical protein
MLGHMIRSGEHGETASSGPAAAAGIPEEFFIFVDQSHPMAQHNYRLTKTFTSRFADRLYTAEGRRALDDGQIDPMPFAPNPNADPSLSPFAVRAMNDYRIEWDAELCRKAIVPQAPSRMSAVFAFGDVESCVAVNNAYGWGLESVRKFVLVDPEHSRVARVNMEIISLMRATYPLAAWQPEHLHEIWRNYWTGGEELTVETPDLGDGQNWTPWSCGVVWEYLIEGTVHTTDDTPVFN